MLPLVQQMFPPLSSTLRKGDCGRIAVVGGSFVYSGAPYFSAITSLKTVHFLKFLPLIYHFTNFVISMRFVPLTRHKIDCPAANQISLLLTGSYFQDQELCYLQSTTSQYLFCIFFKNF